MRLSSLRFTDYKAFPGEQHLDLKPLTLVFGKNSAGKSAVVRLPILLLESLRGGPTTPPLLDLNARGLEFGHTIADLVHNRHLDTIMKFEMDFEDGPVSRLAYRIMPESGKFGAPRQRLLSFNLYGGTSNLTIEHERSSEEFTLTLGDKKAIGVLNFEGLIPGLGSVFALLESERGRLGKVEPGLNVVFQLFSALRRLPEITYLGPFRVQPQRWYTFPSTPPRNLGERGERAPDLLALSREGDGQLLQETRQWFKTALGWDLDIAIGSTPTGATSYSVEMWNLQAPEGRGNIADTGSGMSQILPLVVAGAMNLAPTEIPKERLLVCEQPELHLHPAAHGAVADLLIKSAQEQGTRLLVETHSEMLLLRIRRRIAEGLSPDLVAIYWVDDSGPEGSQLMRLNIEADGYIEDWPEGVFREDADEARALARAMRERGEQV